MMCKKDITLSFIPVHKCSNLCIWAKVPVHIDFSFSPQYILQQSALRPDLLTADRREFNKGTWTLRR